MNRFLFYGICVWMGLFSFHFAQGTERIALRELLPMEELQKEVQFFPITMTRYTREFRLYVYSIMTQNGILSGPFAGEKIYLQFPLRYLKKVHVVAEEKDPSHSALELILPLLTSSKRGEELSLLLQTADGSWRLFSFQGFKICETQGNVDFFFPPELHDLLLCIQLMKITQFYYLENTGTYETFLQNPLGKVPGAELTLLPLAPLLMQAP